MADRVVILSPAGSPSRGRSRSCLAGSGPRRRAGRHLRRAAGLGHGVTGRGGADAPVSVRETTAGRYRVEGEAATGPAATAAIATWLAEHDAALTDLTAGRTLEDVYLERRRRRRRERDAAGGATVRQRRRGRRRRRFR